VIPELGQGALLVALGLALYGAFAAAIAGGTGRVGPLQSAQHAAVGVFVLVVGSLVLLTYAFLRFDFSVRYVATNTNLGTPFYYRITAVWGALEGSIILWGSMLALYTLVVIVTQRERAREFYPWVLATMLGVLTFFLLVMTIAAPPFSRLTPIPTDGRGLNPLLEDTGMITHPLALYLGFTGFTVPFAFAIAALATGRVGEAWIVLTRRWTIVAWYFLSLGLLIGGWWSYHVLGWGGYWAWDPVENAAFMPWLTGTALLHSVMIQERRRMLKLWNLTLVILTFSLTLFGTFLTRSGIIASVHAFTQGSIGMFFLGFLALVVLGALGLLAWRWDALRSTGELDSVVSRESAFLLNNVLLVAAGFTVFFGTVFPLLSEAVRGTKVSVGAPFFNQVNVPLFLSLIFLMGVGPLIAWRRASWENLRRNFVWPLAIGIAGAALFWALGVRGALAVLSLALTVFVAATITTDFARATRARLRSGQPVFAAMGGLLVRHNRRYGGFIVHLGILVITLGVTGSQAWSVQTETTLRQGEVAQLAGYRVRFDGLAPVQESNHFRVVGTFTVSNGHARPTVMQPAKKFYPQETSPIAGVDYVLGFREDLYLVLGDFTRDGAQATIKIQVNRLVSWIWIGGVILTLGAVLAILPERRSGDSHRRSGGDGDRRGAA
jgi:cytochrome c-type biogenesis protein CcmF